MNRLQHASSPYLLQHSHNPVDWYPWGEEAFRAARERDVPVFLSIGYATCYWCHVMERESFENSDIARLMNEHFVCVKVDREEHPELDDVYMAATVMMSGHGGWPMSVFLEPEFLRPFWCGTYFPATPMRGMEERPTFPQVLRGLAEAWKTRRGEILDQSTEMERAIAETLSIPKPRRILSLQTVTGAVSALLSAFDRTRGGFGGAPKFPQTVYLELLLDVREAAGDQTTAQAVDEALKRTLDAMMIGGLHDQVGGGFHRYCVDGDWTVPHFEKMLYDQALLTNVYARASKRYADPWYADAARRTMEFVLREMKLSCGLFMSAIDAEVDGREGLNYLWDIEHMRSATGADSDFACEIYGLNHSANFKDPHHPEASPMWVPRMAAHPAQLARSINLSENELREGLQRVNESLYAARERRKQPRKDDKSVTAWTGMMIASMARAGAIIGDDRYVSEAAQAAESAMRLLFNEGRLARTYRDGAVGVTHGTLDDYAHMIDALAALAHNDPTHRDKWIAHAQAIAASAEERFRHDDGTYDVESGRSDMFVRTRSTHDGATPSGFSTYVNALLELEAAGGGAAHGSAAAELLDGMSGHFADSPVGSTNALRALLRILRSGGDRAARFTQKEDAIGATGIGASHEVVRVMCRDQQLIVGKDHPAQTVLRIEVDDGFHIVAADPGSTDQPLVPLRISLVSGAGVRVYADYPQGERFEAGGGGAIQVHHGAIEIPVAIEAEGDWRGTPLLGVTFQACAPGSCKAPSTVELEIAIDRA